MSDPSLQLEIFRTRMRARRKQMGITQQSLADQMTRNGVGISREGVAYIETSPRTVRLPEALAIADALETTIEKLVADPSSEDRVPAAGLERLDALQMEFRSTPPGVEASIARAAESALRIGRRFAEREKSRIDLDQRKARRFDEDLQALRDRFHLVVDRLSSIESVLEHVELRLEGLSELRRDLERIHEDSLAGYGADATAPIATGEAATSPVGDTVRDPTDKSSPPG